uniref:2-dehydro-3-deoxygalactonokinase n=1 Tax=Thioclava sp. UBA3469 TaxID=1947693 RepID=UPI00257C9DDE
MSDAAPDWIAADWGTTHLRVWAMRGREVLDRRSSEQGMGKLTPAEFGPVLEDAVAGWGAAPVVTCGMVGSRQGWAEAPYAPVPCAAQPRLVRVPDHAARPVYIACGLRQDSPPDVMRGEETQIAGFLLRNPGFEGTICLPGTHTKWVALRAGRIERFRSCMTGEIYDLLAHRSVLRHTIGEGCQDMAAFDAAVAEALADPAAAYGALFALRAGDKESYVLQTETVLKGKYGNRVWTMLELFAYTSDLAFDCAATRAQLEAPERLLVDVAMGYDAAAGTLVCEGVEVDDRLQLVREELHDVPKWSLPPGENLTDQSDLDLIE